MRRMDRYHADDENHLSRMDKNQTLYQNFSNNVIYTNITDITNTNAYDLSNNSDTDKAHTTREAYQQMQKYQNLEEMPQSKKELADFNHLYQKSENKVYDINSVLEEARKNRQEDDGNEAKRRLKNNAYNILSGVNKKELERYREEKKKRIMTPEEEEMRELIDTIASKTLAGEIDKATSVDLLSDLMATNMMDKVSGSEEITDTPEITAEITVEEKMIVTDTTSQNTAMIEDVTEKMEKTEEVGESTQERNEFYSKSMELSDEDLELSDDFKESTLSIPIKILIVLIILGIIAIAAYFIYLRMK